MPESLTIQEFSAPRDEKIASRGADPTSLGDSRVEFV
jgi:hypothetical protein